MPKKKKCKKVCKCRKKPVRRIYVTNSDPEATREHMRTIVTRPV